MSSPLPRYPPFSAFVLCCLSQDELRSSRPINFSNPEGGVVVMVVEVVVVTVVMLVMVVEVVVVAVMVVVVVVVVAEEVKLLNADVI